MGTITSRSANIKPIVVHQPSSDHRIHDSHAQNGNIPAPTTPNGVATANRPKSANRKHVEFLLDKDSMRTITPELSSDSSDEENPELPAPLPIEFAFNAISMEREWPPERTSRDTLVGKQIGVTSVRKIHKRMARLSTGELYQDKEFPPKMSSVYFSDNRRGRTELKWQSPQQLVKEPKLLVNGVSDDDVMQGYLGDCWFLASAAVIAQDPKLMANVIPRQGPLYGEGYKGVVHFRFWRYGEWVDVHIDDLLPTRNGELYFARCADKNEFWLPLIEKAYAKLHGSYEAIEGGQSMDALVDLTGGIAVRYELKQNMKQSVYPTLLKAYESRNVFITCSRKGTYHDNAKADNSGLIAGHAYSVTAVKQVQYRGRDENLIKIRNPWGMGEEWSGAWNDNDKRWKEIDDQTRKEMESLPQEDGEFWMNYADFHDQFEEVTVCAIKMDMDEDGDAEEGEGSCMNRIHSEWRGETAGGCRNDPRGYAKNPQFLLTVEEPDSPTPSEADRGVKHNTLSVIIGLMQEHRRSQRHRGVKMLQIAFLLYRTEDAENRLSEAYLNRTKETGRSGTYVNFREVVHRFDLEPGYYVIVPTTYDRYEEGDFMLRTFSNKTISLKQLPPAKENQGRNGYYNR